MPDRGSLIVERVKEDEIIITLDREACMGCGICAEGCPSRIFEMRGGKAAIARKGASPCIRDNDWCAANCPSKAIRIKHRPPGGWGPEDR
ncbi:MAG: ferredoxin [Planctomycetota bacterium]|nr:ferredoxin [Planctomycetota bacterium]